MSYPTADQLIFPVKPYEVRGYRFGGRLRRHLFLWATHLGDDVGEEGSRVVAIGNGEVVWSEIRCGNKRKHNWGGIIVLAHQHKKIQSPKHKIQTKSKAPTFAKAMAGRQNPDTPNFYSIYGHMKDLKVRVGDQVVMGQQLGVVAGGRTPENGWWRIPHLHFAIYAGPWRDQVLPGFGQWWDRRTKGKWWQEPRAFIEGYDRV